MKYKVGDEVLVKAKIIEVDDEPIDMPYKIVRTEVEQKTLNYMVVNESNIVPVPDMTAEEAWELARRIEGMRSDDLLEIFDMDSTYCILQDFSPQEAKAKIEAWEAAKEIKVGDEVDVCGDKGIVTSLGADGDRIHVLYLDGIVNSYRKDKNIKKTGRHIDIDKLLKRIGGDE